MFRLRRKPQEESKSSPLLNEQTIDYTSLPDKTHTSTFSLVQAEIIRAGNQSTDIQFLSKKYQAIADVVNDINALPHIFTTRNKQRHLIALKQKIDSTIPHYSKMIANIDGTLTINPSAVHAKTNNDLVQLLEAELCPISAKLHEYLSNINTTKEEIIHAYRADSGRVKDCLDILSSILKEQHDVILKATKADHEATHKVRLR